MLIMSIPYQIRLDIFQTLNVEGISWSGRLSGLDFLSRIYDLNSLPSNDSRFENAHADIWQHTVNNYDWDDDWVLQDERFDLYNCPDKDFLRFLCEMINPVVRSNQSDRDKMLEFFNQKLSEAGYRIIETKSNFGNIRYEAVLLLSNTVQAVEQAKEFAQQQGSEYLYSQVLRMQQAVDKDPDLAVGTSKEYLESVCKTILKSQGIAYDDRRDDMGNLFHKVLSSAMPISDQNLGQVSEDILKKLYGGLWVIVNSVDELRNKHGTGHGRSAEVKPLDPRESSLAVNSSTTLGMYLLKRYYKQSS